MVNEMIENIKNCDINYIQYGNKKGKEIVLLHGWGQNIEMMKPVGDKYMRMLSNLPKFPIIDIG